MRLCSFEDDLESCSKHSIRLTCGKEYVIVDVEVPLVLDDVLDVSGPLHVILASVVVNADVTHFLVLVALTCFAFLQHREL